MAEDDLVYRWRLDELTKAGYSVAQGEVLASSTCDLHEAVGLLKAGADPDIAFDILAD